MAKKLNKLVDVTIILIIVLFNTSPAGSEELTTNSTKEYQCISQCK